jgi:hypothetical protein
MVRATYSENLLEWGEMSLDENHQSPSFMQIMFGTCGGMVDAASLIFNTDQSCSINNGGVESERLHRARRKMSHSLRRSEEIAEVPEFLDADFRSGNHRFSITGDDVSLLSCYTLEQMANLKNYQHDHFVRESKLPVVLTDVSENSQEDEKGDSWHSNYMKAAPLSGMVVKSPSLKRGGSICSGESISTIGIDYMT